MTRLARRYHLVPAIGTAAVGCLTATPAGAQIRASEPASVSQVVDGTRLTVEYSRPRARGRAALYGTLEPWGTTWTPGADTATTLAASRPVRIHGRDVPAGRYSVWLVLREREPWTLVLDPRDRLFHTAHPDSTAAQIRLPVARRTVAHTEVLTWSFPAVTNAGTTLTMQWGTVAVDVPIDVTPTYPLTVSAAAAAPYLGEYEYAGAGAATREPPSRVTISLRDGALVARWAPARSGLGEAQLLPAGDGRFVHGFLRQGALWSVNEQVVFRFAREQGRVTGFEQTGAGGAVEARGRRVAR